MTINTGRILINSTLSMWKFMSIIDDNDFKVCEIGDETRNIITPAKSIYFSGKCEKVIHTELWHYSTGEVLVEVRTNTFSQLDNYKIFWGYEDYNGYLDLLDFYRYAIFPHYEQIKHFNVDFIYIKLKNKICPIYKVAVRDDIMDFVKKYSTKSNILRG
jgi:hypothetical protein